jgi:hypothetical protein
VPEQTRRKHHVGHQRQAKADAERRQRENLALARRLKQQAARENSRVYREEQT